MINLKKLFRRKKGQGALEYLFMIAAALIIIFVVVRYISQSGGQASQQGDIAALQSQAELGKSALQAKNLWDDNYYLYWDGSKTFYIDNDKSIDTSSTTYKGKIDISNSAYLDDISDALETTAGYVKTLVGGSTDTTEDTLGGIYDECMAGSENACKVLAALGGT